MDKTAQLFSSVPQTDALSLFEGSRPKGQEIVTLLSLTRNDVAKASKVSTYSVRYDLKMPDLLEKWLHDVATAVNLVGGFFNDREKTVLWFRTSNPMLGNIPPIDMIRTGRVRKLLAFIQTALDENRPR